MVRSGRSSATSRTAAPSSSTRCRDELPEAARAARLVPAADPGPAFAIGHPLTPPASGHSPDPALGSGTFPQDGELRYDWRTGAVPPAPIRTAVNAAAGDIEATRESRAALFVYDAAGTNPIGYGTGTCGVNGLACFTRDAPNGFTMWFREHGRVFDWGTLKWCQMYTSPPNGCYDAETVALDEFGHVEGLGHHINYADERDYTDAVSRRSPGRSPARATTCTSWASATSHGSRSGTTPSTPRIRTPRASTSPPAVAERHSVVPYGGTVTFTAFLEVVTNGLRPSERQPRVAPDHQAATPAT